MFNLWPRRIPHAAGQPSSCHRLLSPAQSPGTATAEATSPTARVSQQEKALQGEACTPQLEKTDTATNTQHRSEINKSEKRFLQVSWTEWCLSDTLGLTRLEDHHSPLTGTEDAKVNRATAHFLLPGQETHLNTKNYGTVVL